MKPGAPILARQAVTALERGDALGAIIALQDLDAALWQAPPQGVGLEDAHGAFKGYLARRGFFVARPEDYRRTLDEIWDLGTDFDLYELAAALAACDTTSSECLGRAPRRLFPELTRFSPRCPCGSHPAAS